MIVTLLGTGTSQGIPVIACDCEVCTSKDFRDNRTRAAVMIEQGETNMVIDTGPDFRYQMLREQVKKLDAVLFTHEHKDHIAGLDDVRAFNYFSGMPMDIYASHRVQEALKREFHYAFVDSGYPGIPKFNIHTIDNNPFHIQGIKIQPVEVFHHKLPVFGFRIGSFSYITDANYISEQEKGKIKNSEVLVINALRIESHVSHFTLAEALDMIEDLKPGKAYLTHISHQLGLQSEVEKLLPPNVYCGYDGLKITLFDS